MNEAMISHYGSIVATVLISLGVIPGLVVLTCLHVERLIMRTDKAKYAFRMWVMRWFKI